MTDGNIMKVNLINLISFQQENFPPKFLFLLSHSFGTPFASLVDGMVPQTLTQYTATTQRMTLGHYFQTECSTQDAHQLQ